MLVTSLNPHIGYDKVSHHSHIGLLMLVTSLNPHIGYDKVRVTTPI